MKHREDHIADAAEEEHNLRDEAIRDLLVESGLIVEENLMGPGFYVGDPNEPEDQVFTIHESDAYIILGDMQRDYLNSLA